MNRIPTRYAGSFVSISRDRQVLTINELAAAQWLEKINHFPPERTDIYFTPGYYKSWQGVEQGQAKCLGGEVEGVEFLYPFFIKPITGYKTDVLCFDVITAYGYGGLLANKPLSPMQAIIVDNAVNSWMKDHHVIAELIREHPLLATPFPSVERHQVRRNVYADISSLDDAWSNVEKRGGRYCINKAKRMGLTISFDLSAASIDDFISMYSDKASESGWNAFYHFPKQYFHQFKKHLCDNIQIVRVELNGHLVASSLTMKWGKTLHNHLAASSEQGKKMNANDMLYWGLIQLGHKLGCSCLSFGGGLSMDEKDQLFSFKKKFGKIYLPVYIERRVHDQHRYDLIVEQWREKYPELKHKEKILLCYREDS
jgi:serine/alanine adding enzyme